MNKNSKVLALKYRPKTFKDLIGQEIIAETIYNSIKQNRAANAYLFTGIRGVGKTTIARIVAKALNCKNGIENLCKEKFCENCEEISNSNHIDIFELDAASRSSVENTKELIEFSRYAQPIELCKKFLISFFDIVVIYSLHKFELFYLPLNVPMLLRSKKILPLQSSLHTKSIQQVYLTHN